MELKWSLKELYPSFDDEGFQGDLVKIKNLLKELEDWSSVELKDYNDPVAKMEKFVEGVSSFRTLLIRLLGFTMLSLSVETTNAVAHQYLDQLQKIESEITKVSVAFGIWIGKLENLETLIQESDSLREHEFYLTEIKRKNQYILSEGEELVISRMSTTGSKSWTKLQELLTSTLLVEIELEGEVKQIPLSSVRNLAYGGDGELRKKAYLAELEAYKQIEDSIAAALNGIKGEVITTTTLRGYKSPLEETLIKSRMDEEVLSAMLEAMKESLPSFHKYYKKKAEVLGHKNGLPFYELFAPLGSFDKRFTYQEATDYVVHHFRSFSPALSDYAKKAIDNHWIDVEPRKGKRGGAFCFNLHPIKESRFLLNFDGSFRNVSTLAHELGHGYHGSCLVDEKSLNTEYPMPLAETASIFAETIITNAALKDASKEEAIGILESSISHAGQLIVDIYSRFLFESYVFQERQQYALSVERLKELMIKAQKEAYGDGLDEAYLHPYMWINKSHYYSAERNFYNFPYAFGLLFSLGLYSEYLKQGDDFIPKYDALLAATGKNSIREVANKAGINVASKDFWRSSLSLVEKDIEKFLEVVSELK